MIKKLFQNFSAAFVANLINLCVTVFVTLYIPRFSGVEVYSQWQLYLFYIAYLWIIVLGWPDGIYLFCGGKAYTDIEKSKIKTQFFVMTGYLAVVLPILLIASSGMPNALVMAFVLLDTAVEVPREALIKLLQATNRTAASSVVIIVSRLLFLIAVERCVAWGTVSFRFMALADIATKAAGLLLAGLICKDIITAPIQHVWHNVFRELGGTLFSGSKIMLGNLCAIFIVGIVRLAIQNQWGLIAFGKISLTLSISNLFNIFISALALTLFPALKTLRQKDLARSYRFIEDILVITLFGSLLLCYPAKQILDIWLPQYQDGLRYMTILFPICVYQAKTSLLANTYQKVLRQEKWIFIVNCGVLILSVLTTAIVAYGFQSLDLTIFSIVFLLMIRNLLSEITVWRALKFNRIKSVLAEFTLTLAFIGSGWFWGGAQGFFLYLLGYLLYLVAKRKNITALAQGLHRILLKK